MQPYLVVVQLPGIPSVFLIAGSRSTIFFPVILLLRGAGPSVQNFDKSGTTIFALFLFFAPASTWGLCRRFRIWSNDVPTPGCQCPICWAVSCVAADALFRGFHLFFQKIAIERFLLLDHWKAELNIKSLGNFGINCQYLRKSQFLLPFLFTHQLHFSSLLGEEIHNNWTAGDPSGWSKATAASYY